MFLNLEMPMLLVLGVIELSLALSLVIFWHRREVFLACIAFLIGLVVMSFISMPTVFEEPFNPITLGLPMIALAVIGYQSATPRSVELQAKIA